MDCVRFREVIQRYVDGELGDAGVAWFQKHLSFCPSCAAELAEVSAVRKALSACGEVTAAVPVGFADRVCAAAASRPQPSVIERALSSATNGVLPGRLPRRARHWVYGGLVVAALVIGWERAHDRKQHEGVQV
jgi:anti-sigma factor RsiW